MVTFPVKLPLTAVITPALTSPVKSPVTLPSRGPTNPSAVAIPVTMIPEGVVSNFLELS